MLNESIEHTHDTAVCKLSLFFELEVMRGNRKALTVLCSVVKHLERRIELSGGGEKHET